MATREMHSILRAALLVAACGTSLVACDESRDCEKKRLDLFRAWQEVNKSIEERKLNSAEPIWATIQSKVDVLQSAFATPQVTWDSAAKNRDEAASLVTSVSDSGQGVEIFRATFNAAGAKQAAYYDSCH